MVTALMRWKGRRAGGAVPAAEPPVGTTRDWREGLIADYVAAEDALRAFTDRNFGRMCAICARWTLLAARANEAVAAPGGGGTPLTSSRGAGAEGPAGGSAVSWRLGSWVTNCCNANHALESMSEDSLAGIVASREEGRAWWQRVKRATAAPCAALTEGGCALKRGRPELCNKYFCEAIRDYLWLLGGDGGGAGLAARLDTLQSRWATLYATYGALISAPDDRPQRPGRFTVRRTSGWTDFFPFLDLFDGEIAAVARPVTAEDLAHRLFKVEGDAELYAPFFASQVGDIAGSIRDPGTPLERTPVDGMAKDGMAKDEPAGPDDARKGAAERDDGAA